MCKPHDIIQFLILSACIILLIFFILNQFKLLEFFTGECSTESDMEEIETPDDLVDNPNELDGTLPTDENQAAVDADIAKSQSEIENTPDLTQDPDIVEESAEIDADAAYTAEDETKKIEEAEFPTDCKDCVKNERNDR